MIDDDDDDDLRRNLVIMHASSSSSPADVGVACAVAASTHALRGERVGTGIWYDL